jgi:hypothetical protein
MDAVVDNCVIGVDRDSTGVATTGLTVEDGVHAGTVSTVDELAQPAIKTAINSIIKNKIPYL